jgi:hypothetical protein
MTANGVNVDTLKQPVQLFDGEFDDGLFASGPGKMIRFQTLVT